jgi:hypothetical protein
VQIDLYLEQLQQELENHLDPLISQSKVSIGRLTTGEPGGWMPSLMAAMDH